MGRPTRDDLDESARSPICLSRHADAGRMRIRGKRLARFGKLARLQGLTYGPFAPGAEGQPFPERGRVHDDLAKMRALGANSIRTYHVPPRWLLDLVQETGFTIFMDIPWSTHICFMQSPRARADARRAMRQAATDGRDHSCIAAYCIGNEIPTDIIRWHGAARVERFLAELFDVIKQADPEALVTYASYPPTEYLDLSFLDFMTFNVYLHDRAAFRDYIFRLQNLAGDRPLVLGEFGMDTIRNGQPQQARLLADHLREIALLGLAGSYVFSWTDDWHTGGSPIQDWAFGITDAARVPKASCAAIRRVFTTPLSDLLDQRPRVSVIVCSHNGGATLDECLRSLCALNYPDYEIIVVDDGSTDDTREILARFPSARAIHQRHLGLSVARNAGLATATGTVIAYTDSDCIADPDWLIHLIHQLVYTGAAAAGGPNLTPDDGWLAACVAAAPGQPAHVLMSDQVAEHIPGCNMAFRREALEAINGFDPHFLKAGDDVDICWRLQHAGCSITFAPGAFVWHHRRRNPRAYLKQQAGYGEAEALLQSKHPDKFNGRGDGKWGGVMYGTSLQGLQVASPIIYRGAFGTGMFQCLYQPGAAHWAMLPSTLEWHVAALLLGVAGALVRPSGWLLGAAMLALSILVAALQATQVQLHRARRLGCARLLVAALCYAQPLVRSWARYRTRLSSQRAPCPDPAVLHGPRPRLPWSGLHNAAYWCETGSDRTQILERAVAFMDLHRWGKMLDTGWLDWDISVYCDSGFILKVVTVQEDHGQGRRLIRIRYQLAPSAGLRVSCAVGLVALTVIALAYPMAAVAAAAAAIPLAVLAWMRALTAASRVVTMFGGIARELKLLPCSEAVESQLAKDVSSEIRASRPARAASVKSPPELEPAKLANPCVPRFQSAVALDPLPSPEIEEQLA